MPLDPSIISGLKPVQFDPTQFSSMNAMTNVMKFKQADQESQLNALKMQEYTRQRAEEEGLRKFISGGEGVPPADLNLPETRINLLRYGKTGAAYSEALGKQETEKLTQKKTAFDLTAAQRKFGDDLRRGLSANASDENVKRFGRTALTLGLYDLEEIEATVQQLLSLKPEDRVRILSQSGASAEALKPSNLQVNQGGQTQVLQMPAYGGAGTSVGTFPDVVLPANVEAQQLRLKKAGAPSINLPAQEKAFEGELGKGQAKRIIDSQVAAQDAASIIDTVKTGRSIMKSGMITGAGADFLVNFNQGLKTAGIDAGFADASANSQAFAANMAANVGKLIKQFGAGTGLSDTDLKFAKDMAGGRVTLDAKAINKILDINEKAARNTITRHNKDVEGVKTNIPLKVEMPSADAAPAAAPITAVNPTTGARIQSTDGGKTWSAVGGR
jgi:hypothetical protein